MGGQIASQVQGSNLGDMETLFTMRHSVEQYGHNSVLNMKEDNTVSREKHKNTKIQKYSTICPNVPYNLQCKREIS